MEEGASGKGQGGRNAEEEEEGRKKVKVMEIAKVGEKIHLQH